MQNKVDGQFFKLLRDLVEMQEIMYARETKRSPKRILRMYNLAFVSDYLTKSLLDTSKTKKMTDRRLFGQYNHNLTDHAASQLRIMNLASANTKDEERAFNFLKVVTKRTSNHHPDNVIGNAFICIQVHEEFQAASTSRKKRKT